MTVEATKRNRDLRIKRAQRRRDHDEARRNVRCAKRALGAVRRWEGKLPARMKAIGGNEYAVTELQKIGSRVHAALNRVRRFLPA